MRGHARRQKLQVEQYDKLRTVCGQQSNAVDRILPPSNHVDRFFNLYTMQPIEATLVTLKLRMKLVLYRLELLLLVTLRRRTAAAQT